jgi:hypothetical protein
MSTVTGAPAARARALGNMLRKNGVAAPTAATTPPAVLAAIRKRRVRLTVPLAFMLAMVDRQPVKPRYPCRLIFIFVASPNVGKTERCTAADNR